MKKILGVLALTIVLTTTGCGNDGKKLECTYELEGIGKYTYDMRFDDKDVLKSWTIVQEMVLDESYTEDELKEIEESACTGFEDMAGVTCSVKMGDTLATRTVKADASKMTEEEVQSFTGYEEDATYDKLKEDYTADGFTCK